MESKEGEASRVEAPRFPLGGYLSLMAIMLANCMLISYIFPFIGFFVVHVGAAEDKATAGYSAGIVISMFFLGRGLSNIGWGMFADKYGRKFTLFISLICCTVCMAGFGFSTTLSHMLIWRFLAGFLNGVNSTSKVMSFEMAATVEHKNRGAAFLQAAWGAGLIVGPGIAGYLSEPCGPDSDLAGLFDADHVFCVFPFSLPGIALAVLHLVCFACLMHLPETAQSPSTIRCKCSPYSTLPSSPEQSTPQFAKVAEGVQPEAETVGKTQSGDLSSAAGASAMEVAEAGNKETEGREQYKLIASSSTASLEPGNEVAVRAPAHNEDSDGRWWCQRRFVVLVVANALTIAGLVMANELATLWAILPIARGGPQWSEQSIGKAWVPLGVFVLFVQVLVVPNMINRIGNERMLKWGLLLDMFAMLTLPWVALANPAETPVTDATVEPTVLVMGLFVLAIALQQFLNSLIVCPMSTLISASVDSKNRGRAIGLSTALQSTCMAVSPTLAGWILSATVEHAGALSADPVASFPGGTHPAFFCGSLMLLIPLLFLNLCLPRDESDRLSA